MSQLQTYTPNGLGLAGDELPGPGLVFGNHPRRELGTMSSTINAHPGQPLTELVLLNDGMVATLRALGPDDRSAIRMLFEGLSEDSRYRRFHTRSSHISPALLDMLCAIDGESRVAVGAFHGGRLIGGARYVRPSGESAEAEVAFTVADAYQRRGLGRQLLHALTREAHRSGLVRFRYTIQADNGPAVRLLLGPGARVASEPWQREGVVDVVDILARGPGKGMRSEVRGQREVRDQGNNPELGLLL